MSAGAGGEPTPPVADLGKAYLRALAAVGDDAATGALLAISNIALGVLLLAEPVLFGRVVDALARGGGAFGPIALWALLGLVGIGAGLLVALFADRLAHRRRMAAMTAAFERAIAMPAGFVTERGSGRIVRIMLAGADALFGTLLGFFREHLTAATQILCLFPLAFYLDPTLASLLLALACVYAGANFFVIRRTQLGQAVVEERQQEIFGRMGDVIGNVPVVHAYDQTTSESAGLRALAARALSAQIPVLTWWAMLNVSTRATATIAMVAIFSVGALRAAAGEITVGEIVSFVAFATLLIGRLDQIGGAVARVFAQTPTLLAMFDLIDASGPLDRPGAFALGDVAGRITFDEVSFRFAGAPVGVHDLSFDIPPGQTVAFVGRTGAGKSTALALLQRVREPQAGRILLDGFDIRDLTFSSLRGALSVVPQDAGLFNRSIRDNLRLGRPNATQAEIEAAAKEAEAHDFILRKPGGYDFVIGERGQLLSGGERQRLAIARAILKNAPVLLLDEATSALDPVTERRVKRALDAARRGRTTLMIAHRLTTIMDADLIFVMDQGRIVERGDYATLMRKGGLFAELAAESEEDA